MSVCSLPKSAYAQLHNLLSLNKTRSKLWSMALGYVIAHHATLPTSATVDVRGFYNKTCSDACFSFLGCIGDIVPTDYENARRYAVAFWVARYDMIFGKPGACGICCKNAIYNMTCIGKHLSEEDIAELETQGLQFQSHVMLANEIYEHVQARIAASQAHAQDAETNTVVLG